MTVNKLVLGGGQTIRWKARRPSSCLGAAITGCAGADLITLYLGSPRNKMTVLVAVLYDRSHRVKYPQVTRSYSWPWTQPTESTGVSVPQAAEVKSFLLALSSIVNCKFIPPLCRKRIQTSYVCREDVGLYTTK